MVLNGCERVLDYLYILFHQVLEVCLQVHVLSSFPPFTCVQWFIDDVRGQFLL